MSEQSGLGIRQREAIRALEHLDHGSLSFNHRDSSGSDGSIFQGQFHHLFIGNPAHMIQGNQ